jgi:iron(III) transport system permease protein
MTIILGRNGILTNFLRWLFLSLFQYDIGITSGLLPNNVYGIIFVQTTHLWPLIYLNTSAALSKIDPTLEESAKNLGASSFRLFSKITFPLSLPGYAAGALLVFLWSISDLGTPIMLAVHDYAPFQAFTQMREIGGDVEIANVISVVITAISMISLYAVTRLVGLKEYATVRAGAEPRRIVRKAGKLATIGIVVGLSVLIGMSILPHLGTVLLAFTERPAYGDWIPKSVTLEYMLEVLGQESTAFSVLNSLYYALLSAFIDIFLGAAIAYLLVRKNFIGKSVLDMISMLPFAIPGVVLGLGYIRLFSRPVFGTFRLTSIWFILVISYSMRRLPYAVRASHAVLQQVHTTLEEAAQNLGASKLTTLSRIVIPLMMPGLIAGGIMSFTSAFTEVSTSLLLQPIIGPFGLHAKPITLTIYFAALRGASAMGIAGCLGFIQIIATSCGLFLTNKLLGGKAGLAFGA